jgi:dephospho-CoA kinase
MIKIGITGGLGSGKSVVLSLLEMAGIPVYVADEKSKILTDNSPEIRKKLIRLYGNDIYTDEKLDRKKLASLIFSDESLLKKVNDIIHPVVKKDFKEWLTKQDFGYCALESAILYESGFDNDVDVVIMVYAPVELRLSRAMKRDSATEAEIMRRMNRQMPDAFKREKADFVIINDGVQALIPQVEEIVKALNC